MFGYIRPHKPELKVGEYETYKAIYCGLCRSLGKGYGPAARFTVSYDLTFHAALMMSVEKEYSPARYHCPACPARCKSVIAGSKAIDAAADLSVILAYFSLKDKCRDSGFFPSLGFGFLALLLKPALKKAKGRKPRFYDESLRRLNRLEALEKEGSPRLDEAADTFASLLAESVPEDLPDKQARPMRQMLYNIGRFVYLADAYDDFAADYKSGLFNPIGKRYDITGGSIPEPVAEQLDVLIKNCENMAASAAALLDLGPTGAIIENIIYLGLPAVWTSVKAGTFQKRVKQEKNL